MPESLGKRAIFEGVAICGLTSNSISSYREVANVYTGLLMLGFNADRLSKSRVVKSTLLRPLYPMNIYGLKNKII